MRIIERSGVEALTVFDDCRAGMYRPRKTRLEEARLNVIEVNAAYLDESRRSAAFAFAPPSGAVDTVFTKDTQYLYEEKFRNARASNSLYDDLILLAEGDCPHCGLDSPRTLDHCLPSSIYPHLSVTPLNLIPLCTDCNVLKADAVGGSINAYSDEWAGIVPWLVADMADTGQPGLLTFSARMPTGWSSPHQSAVEAAFTAYSLGQRYHDRAKTRWNTHRKHYRNIAITQGSLSMADHFSRESDLNAARMLNGWEAAAYRCWAREAPRISW